MIMSTLQFVGGCLYVLAQLLVAVLFLIATVFVATLLDNTIDAWQRRRAQRPGAIVRIERPGAVRERLDVAGR